MIYLPYLILSLFYLTAFWTTIIDPYSVTALAQLRNFVSSFFWIKVSWLFWHGIGVYFLQQWFKLWNVTARNAILLTVLIFSLPLYVFIVFSLLKYVAWTSFKVILLFLFKLSLIFSFVIFLATGP